MSEREIDKKDGVVSEDWKRGVNTTQQALLTSTARIADRSGCTRTRLRGDLPRRAQREGRRALNLRPRLRRERVGECNSREQSTCSRTTLLERGSLLCQESSAREAAIHPLEASPHVLATAVAAESRETLVHDGARYM